MKNNKNELGLKEILKTGLTIIHSRVDTQEQSSIDQILNRYSIEVYQAYFSMKNEKMEENKKIVSTAFFEALKELIINKYSHELCICLLKDKMELTDENTKNISEAIKDKKFENLSEDIKKWYDYYQPTVRTKDKVSTEFSQQLEIFDSFFSNYKAISDFFKNHLVNCIQEIYPNTMKLVLNAFSDPHVEARNLREIEEKNIKKLREIIEEDTSDTTEKLDLRIKLSCGNTNPEIVSKQGKSVLLSSIGEENTGVFSDLWIPPVLGIFLGTDKGKLANTLYEFVTFNPLTQIIPIIKHLDEMQLNTFINKKST